MRFAEPAMPIRLPSIAYRGKEYTADLRLEEFRYADRVLPAIECIRFDSDEGQRLCLKVGLERCHFCHGYVFKGKWLRNRYVKCRRCGALV